MSHDDAADEARARAPAALARVHQLAGLVQELRAERARKVVAQVVARPRLRAGVLGFGICTHASAAHSAGVLLLRHSYTHGAMIQNSLRRHGANACAAALYLRATYTLVSTLSC